MGSMFVGVKALLTMDSMFADVKALLTMDSMFVDVKALLPTGSMFADVKALLSMGLMLVGVLYSVTGSVLTFPHTDVSVSVVGSFSMSVASVSETGSTLMTKSPLVLFKGSAFVTD